MKVLKNSLFLFVIVILTNLAWALFYYNNQMNELKATQAIEQVYKIASECYVEGGTTVLKPYNEGFDGACVYMTIRFGKSQFEEDIK